MADRLGDSIDIALFGFDVDSDTDGVDSSLLSTYGYIAFSTDYDGFIPNHTERALNLLIEQFRRDKPLLHGLISAFTDNMQDIENTLYDMLKFMSISTATGIQLDSIGDILGLSRTSGDDDIYRDDLFFQILLNTSNGEPEILIQGLDRLVNAEKIDYTELYPASVILTMNQTATPLPDNLKIKLERILPAGVQLFLYLNNSDTPFIFGGEGSFPPAYVGEGFGETGTGWEDQGGNITELIS